MSEAEDLNFWHKGNNAIKILVLEDEEDLLDILKHHLSALRYRPLTAGNIAEAKKILSKEKIDILVTDIKLPDGRGNEFAVEAKLSQPNIQVIIITGHGSLNEAVLSMKAQAVDFIQKPFEPDQLEVTINRAKQNILDDIDRVEKRARDIYEKRITPKEVKPVIVEHQTPKFSYNIELIALLVGVGAAAIGALLTWFIKY